MIRNLIGQIGVFMICAQAVVHFKPKEAYGKYLRLLLGLMVLVQIFSPVYGLLFGEEGMSLTENIWKFQEEMEESMGAAAESSAISGLQLEDMSLKMLQEIWEQNGAELNGGNDGSVVMKEGNNGAESQGQEERNDTESQMQDESSDTESQMQDESSDTEGRAREESIGPEGTEEVDVGKDVTKKENDGWVAEVEIEIAPIAVGRGEP